MARKNVSKGPSKDANVNREVRKRWKEIERKGPYKWTHKGDILTGIFKGLKESTSANQSAVGILEHEFEGVIKFWAPTILADMLTEVKVGDEIRITCLGKIPARRGDAWNFSVEVAIEE